MKKYKFKKILFAGMILSGFTLSGCKQSFLYTSNPNLTTENTFWNSEADLSKALAATYSPLRDNLYGPWGGYYGFQDFNALGDDVFTIPGEEPTTWQIANFINDPNNGDASGIFSRAYMCIYRANILIANAGKMDISADKSDGYVAEAKFLRGLAYFVLASNWGDVPLRMKPALTNEDKYIPSSPVADVWKQAEQDFTDAIQGLPLDRTTSEHGRATSGSALAYLGKAYLFQKKYDLAESTLEKLTKSPYHYSLLKNYEDNFTDKNKSNNPEAVFQWVYGDFGDPHHPGPEDKTSGMYNYLAQFVGVIKGGSWFKYVPSNFIINQFFKELRPAGSNTKFDKRMYTDFFWKRSEFGETNTTWYGDATFDQIWQSCLGKISRFYPTYNFDTVTHGRFLIRKFSNSWEGIPNADNYWGPKPSTANYIIMRYAEVLLNLAEAQIQNGHLEQALNNINIIRERAGLPDKTMGELGDAGSIMEELKHQRVLELFFEQNRWYDLKRWYTPDQLKQLFIDHEKQGAKNFQAKNYIFPIPASEIQTNNKLTQNPLWK